MASALTSFAAKSLIGPSLPAASSKTVTAAGYATMAVGVAAVAGVAAITIRRRRTAGYTELAADESMPSNDGTPLIA